LTKATVAIQSKRKPYCTATKIIHNSEHK